MIHTTARPPQSSSERLEALLKASRSAVIDRRLPHPDDFDIAAPDFPEDLVPFHSDPEYTFLSLQTKLLAGTGGLLQFCEDTIALELGLINEAVRAGLRLDVDPDMKSLLILRGCEDEARHALQSRVQAIVTRSSRRYEANLIPGAFVQAYQDDVARVRGLRALLLPIAYAAALEVDQVTLYRMARSPGTSSWQRAFAASHWSDEEIHQDVYLHFVRDVHRGLNAQGRAILEQELARAAWLLGEFDAAAWVKILVNAGVPPATSKQLVARNAPAPKPADGVLRIFDELAVSPDRVWDDVRSSKR